MCEIQYHLKEGVGVGGWPSLCIIVHFPTFTTNTTIFFLQGVLDLFSPMVFPVLQGVASVNISFSAGCPEMVLTVTCLSGPLDTLQLCSGQQLTTLPFAVKGPAGLLEEANPIRIDLSLGMPAKRLFL